MSFWVEIHCDVLSDVPDLSIGAHEQRACLTHKNDNPASMGGNIGIANKYAVREAKRRKWKRRASGEWVCPHCQKFPPVAPNPTQPEGQEP